MLKRMIRRVRDSASVIRPRWGQVALGVVLVGLILTIVGTAFLQVRSNEVERQSVFAEEADGTALTFVQRESFGLIIALDNWTRGSGSGRDVQIARAVLGQRLSVVTRSGSTTFELTGASYQEALAALDEDLLVITEAPDDQRPAFREAIAPRVDAFASQTRDLSQVFQDFLRLQTQDALDSRLQVQLLQGILSIVALLLGGVLFTWIAIDINRGFRASANTLAARTARLERTRERLILLQRIDERGRGWLRSANAGAPRHEVFATMAREIAEIVPGLEIEPAYDPVAPVRVVRRPTGGLDEGDDEAMIARAVETVRLIIARDSGEEQREFQRSHDALTGLPNRGAFETMVESCVADLPSDGSIATLMIIDIDRFADLNGSLGAEAGDRVLVTVAQRLRSTATEATHIARLSSDEFGLVGVAASPAEAREQAQAVLDALSFEWEFDSVASRVSVSVGLAFTDAASPDGLLPQRAAAAMQAVKASSDRGRLVVFDEAEHGHLLTTMQEESAIRTAIRTGEFVVHLQPIIALASGDVAGAEALVRWQRPGVGLVRPDEFLPAVARAGLAADLGWEIIDQALTHWGRQLATLPAGSPGSPRPSISINVDAAQLALPRLASFVVDAAQRHGVPPESVVIEVTEHALVGGPAVTRQLDDLRAHGIRVALDDFGTGYSSLAQASSLPLDVLKIDRSFIPAEAMVARDRRLVGDICRIGATLGLRVTAEGVESEAVAADLRELGVDFAQGYLFSPALSPTEFTQWWSEFRDQASRRRG